MKVKIKKVNNMSILKAGRPSTNKDKALHALNTEKLEITTIRLPSDLRKKLKHSAINNNVTINQIVWNCIKKHIEEEERNDRG